MTRQFFVTIALCLIAVSFAVVASKGTVESISARATAHPEEFVNILGGTDSRYDSSHGGSLPLIALPWGFNTYAPQTDDPNGWWFHPSDRRFVF